ncbi:MAG TPA: ATP-binding protein [Chloroflexota bacterium]|nr:ATP-binding protein [Chloroflexota bacterium]
MHNAADLDPHASPDGWLDLGPGWLFASIRDAVIVADAETSRIALWNPAATHLLGFEPVDVVGLALGELIHDLLHTRQWDAARRGGSSADKLELFARRQAGAEICVELTLSPLSSAVEGHAYVLAVVRDVSERRLADEERIERVREIVAQEESAAAHRRLEVLAEASRLLDASLDYEATLQEVAGVAVRTMADWCIVHLLEHDGSIRWQALAHGDPAKEAVARALQERYPVSAAVSRVLRTGESELYGDESGDSAGRRANELRESNRVARAHDADHLRMLRELDSRAVMIVPLVARGRMLGAVSLISTRPGRSYDASDLAIAEELARRCGQAIDNARLHQEAQIAVKARDRFVSIASHELRTPIARVKGYAEMVLAAYTDGDLTDEMLQRSLRRIDHASDRLATLVRDLLDVSRLSSGDAPVLRLRTLDLTELVREVVGRYQEQLTGTGHLLLDIVGAPGNVSADPDRIEQVLTNLLDNALKYSPDVAELHVRVQPMARGLLLEVQDHGIGLPPAAAERIFEPFSRATNAEQLQITGMGLGLFICRNIVEQHHGRIWARSAGEGTGTLISVWLPEHHAQQNKITAAA